MGCLYMLGIFWLSALVLAAIVEYFFPHLSIDWVFGGALLVTLLVWVVRARSVGQRTAEQSHKADSEPKEDQRTNGT